MNFTQDQIEKIIAYVDGDLSPVEKKHFEAEMSPEMRQKIDELRQVQSNLDQLNRLPEDNSFTNRLMSRVQKPSQSLKLNFWQVGVAATLLIGVFAIGLMQDGFNVSNDNIAEASFIDRLCPEACSWRI